jgi:hypothetical protein
MTTQPKMSLKTRTEYLQVMQPQYWAAKTRAAKSALLDQMCAATQLNREYLITKLRQPIVRRQRRRQRGKGYGSEVDAALALIWKAQNYICAERLQPALGYTARNLAAHGNLHLSPTLEKQLSQISVPTVRRHLPPLPPELRRGRPPSPPTTLQRQIPIRRIPWDVTEPGHLEMDLVQHSGPDASGQFGYTLQLIDVATQWSVRRAVLGRSYVVIADALYTLFTQLPFPVKELHPDNGGEFLNHHLLRFLTQYYPHITLSRTHPGRPNDNRFVEQKNATLVRAFVGDRRLDTVAQIRYLNRLYDLLMPYYNLMQPVLHQIEKQHIPATPQRPAYTRRVHDTARPPLQRLCETAILASDQDRCLRQQQRDLDLLARQRQITTELPHLFRYPPADPLHPENVYETLAHPELFPAAFVALDVVAQQVKNLYLPSLPCAQPNSLPHLRKEKV